MSRRRSSRRWAVPAIAVACLGCVFGTAVLGTLLGAARERAGDMPTALARAQAAGLAVTAADLKREATPARDARPALEAFDREWEKVDAEAQRRLTAAIWGVSDPELRVLDGWYAKQESLMRPLPKIGLRPELSVPKPEPRVWYRAGEDRLSETIGNGIRLLAVRSIVHGWKRDLAAAEADLRSGARMLAHFEAEPDFASYLRRCSAEIELQRALMRVAQANASDPRTPGLIERVQRAVGEPPNLRPYLAGELAGVLRALGEQEEKDLAEVPFHELVRDTARADLAALFTRAVQRLPEDAADLSATADTVRRMRDEADDLVFYGGYARNYRLGGIRLADVLARRRLAEAAATLLGRRGPEGYPPVAGELPEDPHSGERMGYKRDGKRAVLYSVGRDGRDDGGREFVRQPKGPPRRDVVFWLP